MQTSQFCLKNSHNFLWCRYWIIPVMHLVPDIDEPDLVPGMSLSIKVTAGNAVRFVHFVCNLIKAKK